MYKAIKEVGGFKIGDIVPDEKAKHWNKVYGVPHCEEFKDEIIEEDKTDKKIRDEILDEEIEKADTPEKQRKALEGTPDIPGEEEKKEETPSNDVMIDDYLDRNTGVVISNIKRDKLSSGKLKKLLAHEKSEKKRRPVIRALKKAME